MKNSVKLFFSVVGSFLSSVLGVLYVPVLLMVLCNVIDYITGLMAAAYRNDGISSYKSMRGIAKKISMWLLVVVGAIIDQVLIYTCDMFGYTWPIPFAVAAVVVEVELTASFNLTMPTTLVEAVGKFDFEAVIRPLL